MCSALAVWRAEGRGDGRGCHDEGEIHCVREWTPIDNGERGSRNKVVE